jgi:hypothetical protein
LRRKSFCDGLLVIPTLKAAATVEAIAPCLSASKILPSLSKALSLGRFLEGQWQQVIMSTKMGVVVVSLASIVKVSEKVEKSTIQRGRFSCAHLERIRMLVVLVATKP